MPLCKVKQNVTWRYAWTVKAQMNKYKERHDYCKVKTVITSKEEQTGNDQEVNHIKGFWEVNTTFFPYLGCGYSDESFKLIVFCTFISNVISFIVISVFKRNSESLMFFSNSGEIENKNRTRIWRTDRINTKKDRMKGISKDTQLHGPKGRQNRQVWLYWWVYEGNWRVLC